MENAPLLTASEVAELLNIKKSTVYEAALKGRLPAVSLWKGKRRTLLRFRRSDIEEFIRERAAIPDKRGVCGSRVR
jgi:excisionase family DNA binding protein